MKIFIVLAALLAVSFANSPEEQKPKERQLIYHPGQLIPSIGSQQDQLHQLQQYLSHLGAANNPLWKNQENRFGFSNVAISVGITITTTSTSTISLTCTVSTTACAAGRRRRQILSDLMDQQFEEIKPSAVNPMEITPVADLDSINGREGREADPQIILNPLYYNPNKAPGQLEPSTSLETSPQQGRQDLSAILDLLNPLVAAENVYSAIVPSYVANLFPTLGFPVRLSSSSVFNTFTKVVCTHTITTIKSTPACSVAGTLPQCPARASAGR